MEPTPADPAGKSEDTQGFEIELLREYIQKIADAAADTQGLEELVHIARSLGRICSDLATLHKAEATLASRPGDDRELRQALEILRAEMKANGSDSVLTSGLD